MRASKVIDLYKSEPLWDMSPRKISTLRKEMGEWIWRREYRSGGKKREELERELYKIDLIIEGYGDFVKYLF